MLKLGENNPKQARCEHAALHQRLKLVIDFKSHRLAQGRERRLVSAEDSASGEAVNHCIELGIVETRQPPYPDDPTRLNNSNELRLGITTQPPLSYPGSAPDSDRAKKAPLAEPSATGPESTPGDRVEGLGNFGVPTGQLGTVEQANEEDAVVK